MKTPVLLQASCKDFLWGGNRLRQYGKQSTAHCIAESWELSCHPDGISQIQNGLYAGKPLTALFVEHAANWFGSACKTPEQLPLVKLIDAEKSLSVQVHPDDVYARQHTGESGKTEMWYVLEAAPQAVLYYGFQQFVTKEQVQRAIASQQLESLLRKVPVKKGDFFWIPPGTVHAIGAGILLAEIQQNSNLTYRLYDYGRKGANGQPRPLHIEQALDVMHSFPIRAKKKGAMQNGDGWKRQHLMDCPYFTADWMQIQKKGCLHTASDSFCHMLVLSGNPVLEQEGMPAMALQTGQSILLPADSGCYGISGVCELLFTEAGR